MRQSVETLAASRWMAAGVLVDALQSDGRHLRMNSHCGRMRSSAGEEEQRGGSQSTDWPSVVATVDQ